MSFIYKITNTLNNKSYIGKTSHTVALTRWKEHLKDAKKPQISKRPLYAAINKYGEAAFIFEILEQTDNPCEREQFFINYYNTYKEGYNATIGRRWKTSYRL